MMYNHIEDISSDMDMFFMQRLLESVLLHG
jgi:hypothetical protein